MRAGTEERRKLPTFQAPFQRPQHPTCFHSLSEFVSDTHSVPGRVPGAGSKGTGSMALTHWGVIDKYQDSWNTVCDKGYLGKFWGGRNRGAPNTALGKSIREGFLREVTCMLRCASKNQSHEIKGSIKTV